MGRKSTFKIESVFAAVGAEVAETGHFTLRNLTAKTGMSTGSIYHRFASREALLAEAWLHAVQLFQAGFLAAIDGADLEAGIEAALATPRFCRAHPDAAIILACCRQKEFVGPETPSEIALKIASVNEGVEAAFRKFSRRIDRPLLNCRLAIVAYPLAAVRQYLPKQRVPASIDAEILKAYRAALSVEP